MSEKNIFEVLKNIERNSEFSEKFLNILKENGYTGTLEEAGKQISQEAQDVLDSITSEDLQNIAGGKLLMNDKLKKALAIGGTSLMAAGTVMPSGQAANKNNLKKSTDSALTYVKRNPVHTGVTSVLGLTTAALLVKSIFGGKNVQGSSSTDDKMMTDLSIKDLSSTKTVYHFINQLDSEECVIEKMYGDNCSVKLKFTKTKDDILKNVLTSNETPVVFTPEKLLENLVLAMDSNNQYFMDDSKITAKGVEIRDGKLGAYITYRILDAADKQKEKQKKQKEEISPVQTSNEITQLCEDEKNQLINQPEPQAEIIANPPGPTTQNGAESPTQTPNKPEPKPDESPQ